jgi:hypothetical protein
MTDLGLCGALLVTLFSVTENRRLQVERKPVDLLYGTIKYREMHLHLKNELLVINCSSHRCLKAS